MKTHPSAGIPRPFDEVDQTHKRETFWQILFPLGLGVVLLILLAIFSVEGSASQTAIGADVAVIWLIIPTLLATLLFIAVTILLILLLTKLLRIIPPYAQRFQVNLFHITKRIQKYADILVEPLLRIHSLLAILSTLTHKKKNQSMIKQLYSGGKYESK